jgi:hypothetical protein
MESLCTELCSDNLVETFFTAEPVMGESDGDAATSASAITNGSMLSPTPVAARVAAEAPLSDSVRAAPAIGGEEEWHDAEDGDTLRGEERTDGVAGLRESLGPAKVADAGAEGACAHDVGSIMPRSSGVAAPMSADSADARAALEQAHDHISCTPRGETLQILAALLSSVASEAAVATGAAADHGSGQSDFRLPAVSISGRMRLLSVLQQRYLHVSDVSELSDCGFVADAAVASPPENAAARSPGRRPLVPPSPVVGRVGAAVSLGGVAASHSPVFSARIPVLCFDGSRCAETLTVAPDGRSVMQSTDKVWGTALGAQLVSNIRSAATAGSPRIHAWDVKLDVCDKGHVFIGVATINVATPAYLGADRHGWGLIGTKALWHARQKTHAGYGEDCRTGSIVRVIFDASAGSLSFSVGGGAAAGGQTWGVAFSGLPPGAQLYPAVALYQKGDKVTLFPADKGTVTLRVPRGGEALRASVAEYPHLVRQLDAVFSSEAELTSWLDNGHAAGGSLAASPPLPDSLILHFKHVLDTAIKLLDDQPKQGPPVPLHFGAGSHSILSLIVPPILARLCFLPRIGSSAALDLLPSVASLARRVDAMAREAASSVAAALRGDGDDETSFSTAALLQALPSPEMSGAWLVTTTPTVSSTTAAIAEGAVARSYVLLIEGDSAGRRIGAIRGSGFLRAPAGVVGGIGADVVSSRPLALSGSSALYLSRPLVVAVGSITGSRLVLSESWRAHPPSQATSHVMRSSVFARVRADG